MPYLIAALILLGAGFGAGWEVNGWRYEAERAAEMRGAREALNLTAKELAKIDVKQVTIRQKVQTNVIEKTVYRECRHDPDTYRLLNDAITGKSTDAAGSGRMPRTGTAD